MRILVCEDDYMVSNAIRHKLLKENYEVVSVTNGNEAIAEMTKQDFDLVITDLLMPFKGGLELIYEIKHKLNKNLPIIVLSTLGNEDTIIESFKLGANDYIRKPFSPNELIIRVQKLLLNL